MEIKLEQSQGRQIYEPIVKELIFDDGKREWVLVDLIKHSITPLEVVEVLVDPKARTQMTNGETKPITSEEFYCLAGSIEELNLSVLSEDNLKQALGWKSLRLTFNLATAKKRTKLGEPLYLDHRSLLGVHGVPLLLYLKVPFAEKDQAKKLGAQWDGGNRTWFCEDTPENQKKFAKWL